MTLGLLASAGTAVCYAVATILQAVGARRSAGLAAMVQPLVVLGFVLDGLGFLLSLVAYGRLPLFVVQTIIASFLVGVVLLAVPVLGVRLRRADLVAIGAAVLGLVVLAASAGDQPPAHPGRGFTVTTLVAGGVIAVVLVAGYRSGPSWLLGLLSGLGYSLTAIGARAADESGSLVAIVTQPMAAVVVVGGAVALVAYVRALERGSVGLAAALVSVVEVVVPAVVGLAVLGDRVRPGWALPAAVAAVVALAACVVLARSPANEAAGG